MTQFPVSTSNEQSIYAALELSKNSWLLANQAGAHQIDRLHPRPGAAAPAHRRIHLVAREVHQMDGMVQAQVDLRVQGPEPAQALRQPLDAEGGDQAER